MKTLKALASRIRAHLFDTLFSRLYALIIAALLISHLLTAYVIFELREARKPPQLAAQTLSATDTRITPPTAEFQPNRPPRPPRHPPVRGLLINLGLQFVSLSIAAWVGASLLTRPVKKLSLGARQLGDTIFSPPMPVEGTREVRLAASTLNQMQDNIQKQLRDRTQFLAAISHDIRTPLTRMKLRLASPMDESQTTKLRDDVNEMTQLLDAVLDYLRDATHKEPVQQVDIRALTESLVDDLQDLKFNLHYTCHTDQTGLRVSGSSASIKRAINNVLDNAFKWGTEVKIKLSVVPNDDPQGPASMVVLTVRDNGPGIPEEHLTAVLAPFARVDTSRNRGQGGVGLGLSITKDIIERAGGNIQLSNRRSNTTSTSSPTHNGLVVTMRLPLLT